MKIAIMQPYFFPYLGYFQLISAVDFFVFLDDVNFIKKGWINRNRLFLNDNIYNFSIPLKDISQYRTIRDTMICKTEFLHWKKKFISSVAAHYKKCLFFKEGMTLIENALQTDSESIAEIAIASVQECAAMLGLPASIKRASEITNTDNLKRDERLIDICKQHGADTYINAIGGKELYDSQTFALHGITLKFLRQNLQQYTIHGCNFIPGLSVLDAIMHCGCEYVRQNLLCGYDIEEA